MVGDRGRQVGTDGVASTKHTEQSASWKRSLGFTPGCKFITFKRSLQRVWEAESKS